jgi:chromosome segregation ATPase
MLERNVKELQEQLVNAQKRVMELNDIVSSYKKEAGILEEEIRKALDITTTI